MSNTPGGEDPKPVRNFAIASGLIVIALVGVIIAIDTRKKDAGAREDEELYAAITNAVRKKAPDVDRIAPFRHLRMTRNSSRHLAFRGWVEMQGSEARKEFEAVLLDGFITNRNPEVVTVKIRSVESAE